MTHEADPCPSPAPDLNRRALLRGGAVLAGAAGATVLGAVAATPASADVGDPVLLGAPNVTSATTALEIDSSTAATLSLTNPKGAALHMEPVGEDFAGNLAVGDLASTSLGPITGLDAGAGVQPIFLATDLDLEELPLLFAARPTRKLDTRWKGPVPASIVGQSAGALDSQGRVTSGSSIDVGILPVDGGQIMSAVFANFTVTGATGAGQLIAVSPEDAETITQTQTSTVNYPAKQSVSNSGFIGVAEVNGHYAIRIFVTKTAHVAVDVTGYVVTPDNTRVPSGAAARVAKRRQQRRQAAAVKLEKATRAVGR